MAGRITSRQKCPACERVGKYSPAEFRPGERGLRCACGKSWATRPVIELKHKGKLYRITCDKQGRRFPAHLQPIETSLGQIRAEIQAGTFHAEHWAPAATNAFLWPNYLEAYLKRDEGRVSLATHRTRRAQARHLAWFEKVGSIRDIRTAHCRDYAALPCLNLALSPNYRRSVLALLAAILREAYEREDIASIPTVPGVSVPDKPIEWLTAEEQAAVLEHIQPQHRPIFEFMMLYGCRPGEACALMWDAVDFDRKIIWFKRTFSVGKLVDTTKSRRARPAPLYTAARAILNRAPRGIGHTYVFVNSSAHRSHNPEGHYSLFVLEWHWRRALKAAGIDRYVQLKNGTRHSLGMQLRNQEGWCLDNIALVMGHINTRTTAKHYASGEVELVRALREGKVVAKRLPRGCQMKNDTFNIA